MNIKIIFIAAALVGCCNLVYGQKKKQRPPRQDVTQSEQLTAEATKSNRAYVELHDGSQFMGEIISDDLELLRLRLIGDNEIKLKHGYIETIKREGENFSFTKKGRYNYNSGVFCNIMPLGLGVNIGVGGTYMSQLVLGYQLNQRLGLGGGFGVENFSAEISDTWFSYAFIPTFAYAKYNLNLNGPRIYALGKLGSAKVINNWRAQNINLSLYSALGFGVALPSRWFGRLVLEFSNSFVLANGIINGFDRSGNSFVSEFDSLMSRSTLKIGFAIGQ